MLVSWLVRLVRRLLGDERRPYAAEAVPSLGRLLGKLLLLLLVLVVTIAVIGWAISNKYETLIR